MPTILQLRRGTTAENAAYTGSVGEITVDTTLDKVILHDGSTAGGAATVGNLQGNIQLGKTAAGEIDTSTGKKANKDTKNSIFEYFLEEHTPD